MIITIYKRGSAKVLFEMEAAGHREVLEEALRLGVGLVSADLEGINCPNAKLQGINLMFANMKMANFGGSDLSEAKLNYITGVGVLLDDADLRNANLTGANIRRANIDGAMMRGAILKEINMKEVRVSQAIW